MSSRRRGGSGFRVVAASVALGCCLSAAPAAHADFDDLLDTVIGAATAGPDVDPAGVPADSDLSDLRLLQDPLSQLDQVLNGSSGSAEAPSDTGTPADGSSGTAHDSADGDSTKLPSIPKFSMPGSGGNGGGSGGSGGSGSPAGGAAKKTNASAANGNAAPRPEALP